MDERYQYIIKNEDTELPMELLKRRLGFSSRLLRQLKVRGQVYLDGRPVELYEKGKAGARITVILPEECSDFPGRYFHRSDLRRFGHSCHQQSSPVSWFIPPRAFLPYHRKRDHETMLEKGEGYKIRFINRLDRDTTGVLLVGKTPIARTILPGRHRRAGLKRNILL